MAGQDMSISAFSRRSLLSIKALRLYDESGLLRPERVDPQSGYRYYSEDQLETARLIASLRRLEVPRAGIAAILAAPSQDRSRMLTEWWKQQEEGFSQRRDLLHYIQGSVLEDRGVAPRKYAVEVHAQPASTSLYLHRHVYGPDLPLFIGDAEDYLSDRAAHYGGALGPATVVYLGITDLDNDGPVEVRIPVADHAVRFGEDQIRIEAAHLQARIRLTRPQVAFPQILQVYQALRRWIDTNGHEIAGPPREMYLGDFHEAASTEPICDVGIPINLNTGGNT